MKVFCRRANSYARDQSPCSDLARGGMRRQFTRVFLCAGVLAEAALLSSGCSSSSEPEGVVTHPVRGKVLVHGQPAAGATVRFFCKIPGSVTALPRGVTEKDGSFTLSSYGANDGAPEGEYKVSITWRVDEDGAPVSEDAESGLPDRLGGRYASAESSNLFAKVVAGENSLPTFELR